MQRVARARSSALARSGERPRKTVKFRTARMSDAGVFGVSLRIVMSSIMRRREPADGFVRHGCAPVLR